MLSIFFYIIVFVLNINERIPHTTRRDRRVACVLHGPGSNPGLFHHFCISLYVECLEIFCVWFSKWFGAFLFSSIFSGSYPNFLYTLPYHLLWCPDRRHGCRVLLVHLQQKTGLSTTTKGNFMPKWLKSIFFIFLTRTMFLEFCFYHIISESSIARKMKKRY